MYVAFPHLPSHTPWASSQGSHQVTHLHPRLPPALLSGDPQLSLDPEDPLEEGMATHSNVLAWKIPMDRGAQGATVHRVAESDTTEAT